MRRLLKPTSLSVILVLSVAFVFSSCSKHKKDPINQQTNQRVSNSQSSNNSDHKELLLGRVINAQTGKPVSHATVTVKLSDRTAKSGSYPVSGTSVTTNRKGFFMVKNIKKGNHVIRVEQSNYQLWKNTVYIPLINKKSPGGPINGFFRPNNTGSGWFHGVFQTYNSNNHPSNLFVKSVFITIGLQKK